MDGRAPWLETDVLALPPPEDVNRRSAALRTLEGRFVFFWGVYRAHSRSEDELVFPALEDKARRKRVVHLSVHRPMSLKGALRFQIVKGVN